MLASLCKMEAYPYAKSLSGLGRSDKLNTELIRLVLSSKKAWHGLQEMGRTYLVFPFRFFPTSN